MKKEDFEEMFEATGYGNFIFDCGDFFISYNPCPGSIEPLFVSDDNSDETALIRGKDFYILNGDFREEYLKLSTSGWEKCYKFFKEKEARFGSTWTTGE